MKVANKITHKHQEKRYSCGAASIGMLFDIPEADARKLVKCRATGTSLSNVCEALDKNGVEYNTFSVEKDFVLYKDFLAYNSIKWPLYVCGVYRDRYYLKGRDSIRHHAIAIADGFIYDSSEGQEVPVDCYEHVFNKLFYINTILVIDQERPDFKKNMIDYL